MTEALIIDDNRSTADALKQMLAVLGLQARVSYGSSPAMTILGKGFLPKFILLDINMRGVDGIELLAYLRREPSLIPVPVFIVTSDDQPETRRKVMKLGATSMILKPATIDVLEAALRKAKIL
jgi:CheY-like chemotaxis protein